MSVFFLFLLTLGDGRIGRKRYLASDIPGDSGTWYSVAVCLSASYSDQ